MVKNPMVMLLGLAGFIFVTFLVVDRWDNGARFFRSANSFKSHYNSHKEEFAVLAQQFDVSPPLGNNDLCLKTSCATKGTSGYPVRHPARALAAQRDFYVPAIDALDFPDWVFVIVKDDGEVISMRLSWQTSGYFVNASLHYTGAEDIGLAPCEDRPTDGKHGMCAVNLDESWLVKYEWAPDTAFDPPPGTAQAECEQASRESFAAYAACLENSSAPQAELECQDEETIEELTKCMDEMIARKKRGY